MIDNILLILFLLLLTAKILGGIFQKMGLDSSIGELLTGIIFGTSFLHLIEASAIEDFAIIGSVLILFVAGMKQKDIDKIYQDHKALVLGIFLLFSTTILMTLFFYYIPPYFDVEFTLIQSLIFGIAFAIIDIGVPAKVLISKNLIDTPLGKMTLRSSIINIISGLFLFTFLTVFISASVTDLLYKIGGVLLFVLITFLLVYMLSKTSKYIVRSYIEEAELSLALIAVLALAYFTETIGFSSILGAFIAGVVIARLPFAESTSFLHKIKSLSFGLFVPLFFVWFGLEINIAHILEYFWLAMLIFLVYISIRFIISYIFMKKNKFASPGLASSSLLSVDIESLIVLIVAIRLGFFANDLPLTLFAPSVLLSTLLIVLLVAVFSKWELKKTSPLRKKTSSHKT